MASKRLTPLRSIKRYCKEQCCAGDMKSWRECTLGETCPLFPFRFGKLYKTSADPKPAKKPKVLRLDFPKNAKSEEGLDRK